MNMRDETRAFHFCMTCALTLVVLAFVIMASFSYLSLGLERLLSAAAIGDMRHYLASFFPPDISTGFLQKIAQGALETLEHDSATFTSPRAGPVRKGAGPHGGN